MKPAIAAELSWPQVHAFRLGRHHLSGRAPNKDLARIVGEIAGAQAQVMSAAELQIAVRADCTVKDVRDALWTNRTLVKTWLMRGTLHLARAEDLPVYTAAMGSRWVRIRQSWLNYMQVTEPDMWKIVAEIGDVLDGTPLTREELIAVVGKGKSARVNELLRSGWGGMLKPAARSGRLCFGPSRGQSVTFVSPRKWLGRWREVDPEEAIVEMARRYMRIYGPSTKSDFGRWWGAWPGVANAAWAGLESELVTVSVEGSRLQALAGDVKAMRSAVFEEPIQLVPLFDPYLMGYAKRDHLVDRANASKVSRTAGWISACVLADGRVVGTWTHAVMNRTLRIKLAPFSRLPARVNKGVKDRAAELARALGATKAEVTTA